MSKKRCTNCGGKGPFGTFKQRGKVYEQARCIRCRKNIVADLEATRRFFKREFPNDKQSRSWKTMALRLMGLGFQMNWRAKAKMEELNG